MRELGQSLVFFSIIITNTLAKTYEKCELAKLLETKHSMPREDVKNWVCIAEYESTFRSHVINHSNWDGSKDYGLFQLNNKYWCDESYGKNECRMPCSDLLDDDLTDDLACIKKIIRDTERWKGKGEGLTAWVAYVKRCQNRNLDEYMAECWSDPIETNVIHNRDESTMQPEETTENEILTEENETTTENEVSNIGSSSGDNTIINLVRVPIMFNTFPYFQHMVNPYGYIYQQRYQ